MKIQERKNIIQIIGCDEDTYIMLAGIWERSVRATHDFLKEGDFRKIRNALIPDYFPNVDLYALVHEDIYRGFIGLSADKIEMLFIDSIYRWKGYGSVLIEFAKQKNVTKVDVNEQNIHALQFYRNKGFRVFARDETDEAGNPYPILHLSL